MILVARPSLLIQYRLLSFVNALGIKQKDVDNADPFPAVYKRFVEWLKDLQIEGKKAIFVTCGDWDLRTLFPAQCKLSMVPLPEAARSWINVKKVTRLLCNCITENYPLLPIC